MIELDVGVEPPAGLCARQCAARMEASTSAANGSSRPSLPEPRERRLQHVGTRVAHAVDAVPESHQALAACQAHWITSAIHSRLPIASSIASTGSGAPPCSGPLSAQ